MDLVIINKQKDKTDLTGISPLLLQTLKAIGIEVYNVSKYANELTFAFMMATHEPYSNNPAIVICKEDVAFAKLTSSEMEAMLWHEIAHILNNATEQEADQYALDHTSPEVWKSAMIKAYTLLKTKPDGEFAHRMRWLEK